MSNNLWAQYLDREDVYILDTETSGLDEMAEVLQLAVINTCGETVGNQFLMPKQDIPVAASRVHGITQDFLHARQAPPFGVICDRLTARLSAAKKVLVWNADFDRRMLHQEYDRISHPFPALPWQCVMTTYQGLIRADYRPKLEYVYQDMYGAHTQTHKALGDCRMVLRVMRGMTAEHIAQARRRNRRRGRLRRA